MKFENPFVSQNKSENKDKKEEKPSKKKNIVAKAGIALAGLALGANMTAEAQVPDNEQDKDKKQNRTEETANINKMPSKTIDFSVAQQKMQERNSSEDLEGGLEPEKPMDQSYLEINDYVQSNGNINKIFVYNSEKNSIGGSGIYSDIETAKQKSPDWFEGGNVVVPAYTEGAMLRPLGDADTYFDENGKDIFVENEDGSFNIDKAIKTGDPFISIETMPINEKREITENINEGITAVTEVEGDGVNISIAQDGEMKYLLTVDNDDNEGNWRKGWPDNEQNTARYLTIKHALKVLSNIFDSGKTLKEFFADVNNYEGLKVVNLDDPDFDEETKEKIEKSASKYVEEMTQAIKDYETHRQQGVDYYKEGKSQAAEDAFDKL